MTTNDTPLSDLRQRRAAALVPTVRAVPGGFRVSSANRNTDYLVSRPNGHLVCTCPDFSRHEEPDFRCKHILAVEMAQAQGPLTEAGNGFCAPAGTPPGALHVLHRYLPNEDPVRVKLIKNTKGYSWEIAVAERDPDTALATLQDLEQRVRTCFGNPLPEE